MSITTTKECTRCHEVKALELFPRWRTQYQKRCKACFARSLKEKFNERQATAIALRSGINLSDYQSIKELPRGFFN